MKTFKVVFWFIVLACLLAVSAMVITAKVVNAEECDSDCQILTEMAKNDVCDNYCVAQEQILQEYVIDYKDGSAPIFETEQTEEFWFEFWDQIGMLVQLRLDGEI